MFSITSEGLRYVVTCILNQDGISLLDTIVDTGAMYTCYRADQVGEELSEDQFCDGESKSIGGFVDGQNVVNAVKFYKYDVKQFAVGTIDLGSTSIWITFDERVSDNVLGMDILNKVAFLQYDNSDELLLFADKAELQKYVLNEIS